MRPRSDSLSGYLLSKHFSIVNMLIGWLGLVWLLAATAIAAYDFGGVLPYTRWWLLGSGLVVLILQLTVFWKVLKKSRRGLTFLALLTISVVVCHLYRLEIPSELANRLSPGTQSIRAQLMLPSQQTTSRDTVTFGLVPSLTESAIAAWSLAPLAAMVAFFSLSSRETLVIWLVGLTAICLVLSFHGIAIALDRQLIPAAYRALSLSEGGQSFSTFINRNNAAGLLTLGIAANLGLFFLRLRNLAKNGSEHWYGWGQILSDPTIIILTVTFSLIICGLIATGSRGGLLAATVSVSATILRYTGRKSFVTLACLTLVGLSAGVYIQYLGIPGSGVDRLESLLNSEDLAADSSTSRLNHWTDGVRAVIRYAPFGSGLGSYRYAYLPIQQTSRGSWFVNADNLWLEWLVECGIFGVLFPLLLASSLLSCINKSHGGALTFRNASAVATYATIIAVFCSQFFDFGLTLPAMMIPAFAMLASVFCWTSMAVSHRPPERDYGWKLLAMVRRENAPKASTGTGRRSTRTPNKTNEQAPNHRIFFGLAVLVPMVIVMNGIWSMQCLSRDAAIDYVDRSLAIHDGSSLIGSRQLVEWNLLVNNALAANPKDSDALRLSAELKLLSLQANIAEQLAVDSHSANEYLAKASLANVRQVLARNSQFLPSDFYSANQLRMLNEARSQLMLALRYSPCDDRVRVHLLQSDFLEPGDRQQLISQYRKIRPRDAVSLWSLFLLASPEGDASILAPISQQLLNEHPNLLSRLLNIVSVDEQVLKTIDLTNWIPENRPDLLVDAIRVLIETLPKDQTSTLLDYANERLQSNADELPDSVRELSFARLEMMQHDWEQAAEHWQKATYLQPQRTDWQLEHILCLVNADKPRSALQIAKEAARNQPHDRAIKKEIEKLERAIAQEFPL